MKITRSRRVSKTSMSGEGSLRTIFADVDGHPFEFASYGGGQWEVYDYPRRYEGLPHFCGYLPAASARKLEELNHEFVSEHSTKLSASGDYDIERRRKTRGHGNR